MKAKGITFGDGLREIQYTPKLDVFEVKPKKYPKKGRKPVKTAYTAREVVILISCLAPFVFGMIFLTVMIRNTGFYIAYWLVTFGWNGIVFYANKKTRRRGNDGRAKKKTFY